MVNEAAPASKGSNRFRSTGADAVAVSRFVFHVNDLPAESLVNSKSVPIRLPLIYFRSYLFSGI